MLKVESKQTFHTLLPLWHRSPAQPHVPGKAPGNIRGATDIVPLHVQDWRRVNPFHLQEGFRDLPDTGKNCYYRMMTRSSMDWRKLLYGMAVRFQAILRKERAADTGLPKCYIIDNTTLEKSGMSLEHAFKENDMWKRPIKRGGRKL